MPISPQDATAALHDIEDTQARSATLHEYQRAAPHLLIWGAIWVVGYGLSDFFPQQACAVWAVLVPTGLLAGAAVQGMGGRVAWRYGATSLAVVAFVFATCFVMSPVSGRQIATFIPLLVALMYTLRGIWGAPRYLVAGIIVAALTLIGFAFLTAHFLLWMAAVGGSALILAGFWMRKV
jgi:hypothetical protein